jgi:hypothetical protein
MPRCKNMNLNGLAHAARRSITILKTKHLDHRWGLVRSITIGTRSYKITSEDRFWEKVFRKFPLGFYANKESGSSSVSTPAAARPRAARRGITMLKTKRLDHRRGACEEASRLEQEVTRSRARTDFGKRLSVNSPRFLREQRVWIFFG